MKKKISVEVKGLVVNVVKQNQNDYISLTDIARYKNPDEPKDVVKNWMRSRNTIDFLGLRESINNLDFKGVEFDTFKNLSGTNAFTLSPQRWIEKTKAIGIVSRSGKNGGTYAHKDIAIKFANRISVEFELYLIKEFQKLKEQENKVLDRNVFSLANPEISGWMSELYRRLIETLSSSVEKKLKISKAVVYKKIFNKNEL